MIEVPDTAFIDGRFTTLDRAQPQVEALGVRGGTIMAVGSTAEILRQIGPDTRRVDLHGHCLKDGHD